MSVIFHKTRICKFFSEGECPRGSACTYAHSEAQLQPSPDFFRTRLCFEFCWTGQCPAAGGCRYAHSQEELRTLSMADRRPSNNHGATDNPSDDGGGVSRDSGPRSFRPAWGPCAASGKGCEPSAAGQSGPSTPSTFVGGCALTGMESAGSDQAFSRRTSEECESGRGGLAEAATALVVKNTFLHFERPEEPAVRRASSEGSRPRGAAGPAPEAAGDPSAWSPRGVAQVQPPLPPLRLFGGSPREDLRCRQGGAGTSAAPAFWGEAGWPPGAARLEQRAEQSRNAWSSACAATAARLIPNGL